MRTLNFLLVMVLLMSSCGPDKKAIEEAKFDEVMAVHDEVMPQMSTIRKLKEKLVNKADTLLVDDSMETTRQDLENMVAELDAASESMMNWMRNFSRPEEETPHEEVLKFYEEEMKKVTEVKEKMLLAIEKAEKM